MTLKFHQIITLELNKEGSYTLTNGKDINGSISKTNNSEVLLELNNNEPLRYSFIKALEGDDGEGSFGIWDCLTEEGVECAFMVKTQIHQIHLHVNRTESMMFKNIYVYMIIAS